MLILIFHCSDHSPDKSQLKYMVMLEYGDGGTLREYLQNNSENLHWSVRLKFARQLSKAIEFLHEKNLIHKNLVSE
jgi:serine/threonine protein kinase